MKSIELYRIVMGSGIWTLTSADKDQIYDAGNGDELYVATPISRGNIEQRKELAKANLEIGIPIRHALSVLLLASFAEQIVTITVFTDRDGVFYTSWKGRLAGTKPGEAEMTLVFESVFTSLRRPGLRARFQKFCRHALYGRGCNLNPVDFEVAATLNAITGATLTVPEAALQPDGRYTGGMVAAPDGALSYVINHVSTSLTLQRVGISLITAFVESGAGLAIKIYPGCKHSRADCNDFFDNLNRYGGFDHIPRKNPMGGSSIV